jgi:serine/threonine-protein kinase
MAYFAMELVAGRDLDSLVQEHAAFGEVMPAPAALAVVRGIGRGLSAVHARGVVHRDVKPSNVIVETGTLRPVLIDFGLAQRPSTSNPRISLVGGTPSYMAPEQAMDAKGNGAGPHADIYAFACSVFEILTGRPPFEANTTYEVLVKHLKEPPPRISERRPELARLDDVLLRAMAKKPDERPPTCDAFVAEVEAALG